MKFLFVHQNFPGQYVHILRHLASRDAHEILFLTEPNENHLSGVRKMTYQLRRKPSRTVHHNAREFELALIRAEAVESGASRFSALGFKPDIIIGHHGWGEMLNLRDPWPDVPMLGYFEFFYRRHGLDVGFDPEFPPNENSNANVRSKNAVNLVALELGGHGQTPTRFQHETYPAWARSQITVIPEGADLDLCKPDSMAKRRSLKIGAMSISPKQKLISFVVRSLEPYRGFHTMMRALPAILRGRQDVQVAMVGGDDVSYGALPGGKTWRTFMLEELGDQIDLSRVHFLGKIPYDDYRALLRRSDLHIYLTYPFVASWSLREALATGCAIVASNTAPVREFITDGHNGVLVDFPNPAALAETALRVLDDKILQGTIRANARAYAETHLPMQGHIDAFTAEIERLTGQSLAQ